jgi:hypothetical protein
MCKIVSFITKSKVFAEKSEGYVKDPGISTIKYLK